MNEQLQNFVRDFHAVLQKHNASLYYTTADDGIHVSVGGQEINLGFDVSADEFSIEEVISGFEE